MDAVRNLEPRPSATTFLVRPQLDAAAITVLSAALLDTVTTYLFVVRSIGVEQNPLLRTLLQHSFLWIPLYLLSRPALVAFMAIDHRIACAVWGSIIGFSMTINNIFGIVYGNFLLYSIGIDWWFTRSALPIGFAVFLLVHIKWRTSFHVFCVRFLLLCVWGGVAELIERGFWYASSIVSPLSG